MSTTRLSCPPSAGGGRPWRKLAHGSRPGARRTTPARRCSAAAHDALLPCTAHAPGAHRSTGPLCVPQPVVVRLGGVTALPNRDGTLVVEVLDAAELDQARRRLFDATHAAMGGYREWPWHITWVRYGIKRDSAALLALAEHDLRFDTPWTIDTVSLLELRAGRYEPVAEWCLV